MIEDITENMNSDGHDGIWYSYIQDMQTFRVRLLANRFTVFTMDGDSMQLAPDEVSALITREVENV